VQQALLALVNAGSTSSIFIFLIYFLRQIMSTIIQAEHNVVTNDITTTVKKGNNATHLLVQLETERKKWEEGAYKTSNKQLYAILSACLLYGGEVDIAAARKRSEVLEKFYERRKYRYKKDSPLMTRIIRAVFGDIDRRRLSTYSLVLREAQKQKVLPSQLADWIESNGGVQEIRLSQSKTFVGQKARVAIGNAAIVKLKNLAVVKTDELTRLADAQHMGTACVLIAEQQADGSFAVKKLLRSSGVVNAALAALYTAGSATTATKQAEQAAANDAAKEQAVSAAAASAQIAA